MMRRSSASILLIIIISLLVAAAQAQPNRNGTTHPAEVLAINSIFSQWQIWNRSAGQGWNISGEPCSGVALDSTPVTNYYPGIKCDCSFPNSTCHITALSINTLNVRGVIPDELWTLTYLTILNLAQNYLTGPLSPAVGNLTRMQWFTISINALSGEVPRELGRLSDAHLLSFSGNNFHGPLPSEIGNCSRLEQIYMDSSGVSGVIPSTFANLWNLQTVWASDNQFTGRIPSFIGNWSQLQDLRFQGNSFEGPIPPTFSNLTALTDLRISELSNGSSSLEFLANLKNLSILILRNNNIFGPIPFDIGEYQNLLQLDLSFNNLTGQIPSALFNLTKLTFLYLGNNSLTGTLPAEKSTSLLNIDLSYNGLSGSLPSWVNESRLELNLVGNSFALGNSNNSVLPSGLNCLQRNFQCNQGPPRYYNFSINSGGQQITSYSQLVYERDTEALGPMTYYVAPTNRWAVSNVGERERYTAASQNQFPNTLDSELFQTARLSGGSLRYYGLGLENGNYTVNLRFAELEIADGPTWHSLGRRLFDIYIQGNLVYKDFDIKMEAGGSFLPVSKDFTALVSENYLEVHLFWAGKGTCCIPRPGVRGPSISAISAIPKDFIPTVSPPSVGNNSPSRKNRTGMIVGIVVPVVVLSILSLLAFFHFVQRKKRYTFEEDEEFMGMDAKPYTFTYAELRYATGEFNPANKLGEGGFGPVYKGTLDDGREIAVKQLSVASQQGKKQFMAEIATISAVQHRNLVKLYGCCIDGDKRLLVYEYLENKSLDQALFGNKSLLLDWSTRFEICLGISRGLAYLHEESRVRIVHRDVKASNVLLDCNLNPKISDFGLAKLYDDKKTHMSTRVAGTIGYLAPEYAMRGRLTEKADVFGFGVVALEIVCGRPNSDPSMEEDEIYLLEWAWNLHENNREIELVDANLSEFDEDEVKRIIGVALLCTQTSPALRPSMSRVVAMLSGDAEVSTAVTKPEYLTNWKYKDTTSFMSTGASGGDDDPHISTATTSSAIDSNASPINISKSTLSDIIGDGR